LLQQFIDPSPERAHASVKALVERVPGGSWLRAFHYWTAQAVVVALMLHILRVFITGAYKQPRILTWYFGLGLLGLGVFGSYFTGTVLKGDQEAFDALAHYRAGVEWFGAAGSFLASADWISLNVKLYASHVTILPLLLVLLIAAHFYLVNVHSLSPLPFGDDAARTAVPADRMTGTFLEHATRILIYGSLYFALVAVIAWVYPAPLGEPSAGMEMGIKPPWPFLWLYALENMTGRMDTMMHGIIAFFVLLALVPVLDRGTDRHPARRKITMGLGAAVLLGLIGLSVYAAVAPPQLHEHEHAPPGAMVPSAPGPLHDEGMVEDGEEHGH
ncbi:MAG: cytochrome b N-terminal domain-containing protein, partial [Nitrospiria bacterium]